MSTRGGEGLRERLGELVRRRRTGAASATATPEAQVATATDAKPKPRRRKVSATDPGATGVEAFLPGGEWRHAKHGTVYVHERLAQ